MFGVNEVELTPIARDHQTLKYKGAGQSPRRQKKQVFFGYSPPISVDSVYFFVGFLDKNRHSPPISEFIPQIMEALHSP